MKKQIICYMLTSNHYDSDKSCLITVDNVDQVENEKIINVIFLLVIEYKIKRNTIVLF